MNIQRLCIKAKTFAQNTRRLLLSSTLMVSSYFFIFSVHIAYAIPGENIPGFGTIITFAKWLAYTAIAITAIGYLLWGAGLLFDISLQKTVLNFSELLLGGSNAQNSLMSSIYTIWTASRDIANILIIGIFVYIAFLKIVGSAKNFNKLVVSLLSVAILINFSFFFTQVVIDISNWSAVQVYNAISPEAAANDNAANTVTLSKTIVHNMRGVAMGFGVWKESAASFDKMSWSSYIAIIPNILIVSILTLITAVLFFRMAFILIGRWVVLVMLMATSSLAFAAMLIPKLQPYWKNWYEGLVYNAIVAPLLLLLLWAATLLMIGVSETFKLFGDKFKVDMNKLATDQGLVSNFADGLIGFAIMIGLLWAAIRIATMLSNKAADSAGGLGKLVQKGLGHVEGLGYRGVSAGIGFAGRNSVGRGFSKMGDLADGLAAKHSGKIRGSLYGGLGKGLGKIGKRAFDPRNTGVVKNEAKEARVNIGKGIKDGFSTIAEKKDKEKTALLDKAQKATNKKFEDDAAAQRENERIEKELAQQEGANRKSAEQAKESLEQSEVSAQKLADKVGKAQKEGGSLRDTADAITKDMKNKSQEKQTVEQAMQKAAGKLGAGSAKIRRIKQAIEDGDATAIHDLTKYIEDEEAELKLLQDTGLQVSTSGNSDAIRKKESHLAQLKEQHTALSQYKTQHETLTQDLSSLNAQQRTAKQDLHNKMQEVSKLRVDRDDAKRKVVEELGKVQAAKDKLKETTDSINLAQQRTEQFAERVNKVLLQESPEIRSIRDSYISDTAELQTLLNERTELLDKQMQYGLSKDNQVKLANLSQKLSNHSKVQTFITNQRKSIMLTKEARAEAAADKEISAQLKKLLKNNEGLQASVNTATTHNANNNTATQAASAAAQKGGAA